MARTKPASARKGGRSRRKSGDEARGKKRGQPEVVVAGIGASAGGLAALKTFFQNVAEDSGLAWVVVVHLSPHHESHLSDLLQSHVRIPVLQVNKTTALKPNRVYVIPPNANLSAIDTHLRLSEIDKQRGSRAPIDHFFRTLAETHDGHAIGIVLTGTGSDGAIGIKEIKQHGGLTVVQDPAEAEYDGMPQAALATGIVDLVLPVAGIPGAVTRYAHTQPQLPGSLGGDAPDPGSRILLQKIYAQIRARTGRDFTPYKRSTILRRIQRRMQLRFMEDIERYVEFLRQTPDEVRALSDDLLITVTSFFRDPDVFERLKDEIIPRIFSKKGPDDEVRVWCVGCATGEEVYSIAMFLLEQAEAQQGNAPRIQLFATDLHERSLDIAREGFYAGDVMAGIPAGRLRRFFDEQSGGYRVHKEVRNVVVYARHNLLTDPPFSRLDLIVCRNLLIYLQRDAHRDVFRIFHYALRPDGYLILGTSETIDDAELFRTIDKRQAIYARASGQAAELPAHVLAGPRLAAPEVVAPSAGAEAPRHYPSMHQEMSQEYDPPSILIGPAGELVYLSQAAGRYLAHPGGGMTASAVKLVREELTLELMTLLQESQHENRATRSKAVKVSLEGEQHLVVMNVRPAIQEMNKGYRLVIFEEQDASAAPDDAEVERRHENPEATELAAELAVSRHRLRGLITEFEATQEETKASNEELQSANEELRSTMEELETSKEELESMNEELQSVNQENRHRMEELALLSGDLQNLLVSTGIATLFLDREFRILRFTPRVADLFNVRETDAGRPVSDLTNRLGYPEFQADAEEVLRRLTLVEREVRAEDGRWYLARLLPYRSQDDHIQGIVVAFVDVTRGKLAEMENMDFARTLEKRVAERTRQVHQLTTSLVLAEQAERRRLSETLHDELQQLLYGAQLKLRLARDERKSGKPDGSDQHVQLAESLLAQSVALTRRLSVNLNPPILRGEGLLAILGWLRDQMRELHGLEVRIDGEREVPVEDADVRVVLFQIMRELLFNVAKHSGSKTATVTVKEANGELRIGVADNGKGFDAPAVLKQHRGKAGMGLGHVGERVRLLGGHLQIESQPGQGSDITISLRKGAGIGE